MPSARLSLYVWNAALATLVSCGTSQPPATSPAQPEPAKQSAPPAASTTEPAPAPTPLALPKKPDFPPSGASLERVMQAHFKDALLIREAVIAGRPEQAANPATVLSMIENLDDLPPGWRPFVQRMQQDARHIIDSTSQAQTAAATADLGVSCGACHQQHGGPKVSSEPPPLADASLENRMKRHVWACDRLWEGLTVPSNDAWLAGANALISSPFPDDVLKRGGVHARSAANDFGKLVARAPSTKSIDERAALYAELLVTCGTCHQATRK